MTARRVDQRRLRVSKGSRGNPKAPRQSADLPNPALDQDLLRKQTWLTVPQVVAYLQFPSAAAMREWATRHGVRKGRRGRTLVFRRTDLDKVVQPAGQA